MHCFYCLMLCAMNCNSENISTKIKLFLCFKSIKGCQIVLKCCWSRYIPQDICLIYSRLKFCSPDSSWGHIFTIVSGEICIFRPKQQSLKWGFVILKMSPLKAISTQSFMPLCVTLELQWDCPDCAKWATWISLCWTRGISVTSLIPSQYTT